MLREHGSCDISFGLPGLARFRVNVFIQRGSCAVVMRVIPTKIPEFSALGLPPQLGEIASSQGWHRPGDGRARVGKILHPGGAARPHQRKADLPHHHYRRPH